MTIGSLTEKEIKEATPKGDPFSDYKIKYERRLSKHMSSDYLEIMTDRSFKERRLEKLYKPGSLRAFPNIVRDFYYNMRYDVQGEGGLIARTTIRYNSRSIDVTLEAITKAWGIPHELPSDLDGKFRLIPHPILYFHDMVKEICDGLENPPTKFWIQKTDLNPEFWYIAGILEKQACPKENDRYLYREMVYTLYYFKKGFWVSIPKLIYDKMMVCWHTLEQNSCASIHTDVKLCFPFLLTTLIEDQLGEFLDATDEPMHTGPKKIDHDQFLGRSSIELRKWWEKGFNTWTTNLTECG